MLGRFIKQSILGTSIYVHKCVLKMDVDMLLLVHTPHKFVDGILAVSVVTSFNIVVTLFNPTTIGSVQFKWPQKVVGFLEVWTNGEDLMNQVLNTNNTQSSELFLDNIVAGNGDTLSIHLAITTLEDEFLHSLQIRVSEMYDS